ncbi:MAG: hypothetical protein H6828_03560 [Planctomycetes bacterium]|nr:hypothetical protein [Planctomycetota bacterium]
MEPKIPPLSLTPIAPPPIADRRRRERRDDRRFELGGEAAQPPTAADEHAPEDSATRGVTPPEADEVGYRLDVTA